MIRAVTFFTFLILSSFSGSCQVTDEKEQGILLVDLIASKTILNGDTIWLKIRNKAPQTRGFTIAAVSTVEDPYFYNDVFSAFINRDSTFFKQLKSLQEISRKKHIKYVLPKYELVVHEIPGNSEQLFSFVVQGIPVKKSFEMKIKVETEIVDDTAQTYYTNPIRLRVIPN